MSTLANAVAVLRLFSAERPHLSVGEVTALLALPKSSASRLLSAMRREGLLAQFGTTSRYCVGTLLFEIGRHVRGDAPLLAMADEALAASCRETGHTGYVSILDGQDVMVVRMRHGTHALRVVTPLGSRAPAAETSTGRALLARMSDDRLKRLYPTVPRPRSPNSPADYAQLLAALSEVRRVGWCEAVDEAIPGVGSIAVAIGDPELGEQLSFCISYPAATVGAPERQRIIRLLTDAARSIGTRLKDPTWTGPERNARDGAAPRNRRRGATRAVAASS
ncbi:MAG: IclR family transcriptional regulator [Alphaproteobacteria bacterium]|nr:IclR family transcriptional regulator [Alphaproteobacteria bacterium]